MGRTNIFFVVGTGHVNEERNRLIIWDNAKEARAGSVLFKEPIIDIWSEGENWLIVHLAGSPDLFVFDINVGFSQEHVKKIPLPEFIVNESKKFMDIKHA
jgi:hypothetical protein